jgi:hypothetical protein
MVASVGSQGFGAAVAMGTDTLIVGAPDENGGEYKSGAAYMFVRSGGVWSAEQRLADSEPGFYAQFGRSVAVSGDATLAGAPGRDDGSGSAFVFRAGVTWAEETRLDPPGTASFDQFGSSIALEGDLLVVGAPYDDIPGGRGAGSVYVFVRAGASWTLQQKIFAPEASDGGHFGTAVALSGDTLAVAAPASAFAGGAAYVFVRTGGVWQQQQKLVAPSPSVWFGWAVSLDGDSLIVGAPGEDEGGASIVGAAYVFVRTGVSWSLEQRLVSSSTPASYANAGVAVALEGDTAVVGAPGRERVLVFRRSGGLWAEASPLIASDGALGDGFGKALALSSDTLIVGSPSAEGQGVSYAGAAYVFVRSGNLWMQQQKLVAAEFS